MQLRRAIVRILLSLEGAAQPQPSGAQKRNYVEALPELEKAAQRRGINSLASLGHVYGLIGRKKEAGEILAELKKRGEQKDVSDYQIALVYIGLGETDAAMEALDQAYR